MEKKIGFFKKFLPVFIILAVLLVVSVVDFINAKSYEISLVSAYTTENVERDPEKNYFSSSEQPDVTLIMEVRVTKYGKPCKNHTIAAVGRNGGLMGSRNVTDENGITTWELFVYSYNDSDTDTIQAGAYFFEESSAYIVEYRVDKTLLVDLHRRP